MYATASDKGRVALTMATSATVSKYLDQYAIIPGAMPPIEGHWDQVLVVPCFDESPNFIARYSGTLTETSLLLILVLNRPLTAQQTCNDRVRNHLVSYSGTYLKPGFGLFEVSTSLSLLLIDLEMLEGPTPIKQGVGRARRIGCDVASQLIREDRVKSAWICSSDADACWSDALFDQAWPSSASAVTLPFTHLTSADQLISEATLLYELRLHHYVLQLMAINSPYAFHTLGSACAFNAEAYAAVRGMPLRSAAEDFYILNKLAKVAPVHRATGPMVTIDARTSSRVPFGTGPAVQKLTDSALPTDEPIFYDARCFEAFNRVHQLFERWITAESLNFKTTDLETELGADLAKAVGQKLEQWQYQDAIVHIHKVAAAPDQRRPHLVTWLDGFKTLQLIHAIRDAGHPKISFKESIQREDQWLRMSEKNPTELLREIQKRLGWQSE